MLRIDPRERAQRARLDVGLDALEADVLGEQRAQRRGVEQRLGRDVAQHAAEGEIAHPARTDAAERAHVGPEHLLRLDARPQALERRDALLGPIDERGQSRSVEGARAGSDDDVHARVAPQ